MNEEEIRSKILLPFLKDLGFELTDISLETRFTIRLGKSKHKVGRSDILCKRYGRNLFVIELKNDSVTINQRDIDQGISYARLLPDCRERNQQKTMSATDHQTSQTER